MSNESNINLNFNKLFTVLFIIILFLDSFVLIIIDNNNGDSDGISFILILSILATILFGWVIIDLFGNKYSIWSAFTVLTLFFGELFRYFPTNIFIYPGTENDFDVYFSYFSTFETLRNLIPENLFQFYFVIAFEILFVIFFLVLLRKNNEHDFRVEFVIYIVVFFLISYFFIISTNSYLFTVNYPTITNMEGTEPDLILSRFLTFFLPSIKGIILAIFYFHFLRNKKTNKIPPISH